MRAAARRGKVQASALVPAAARGPAALSAVETALNGEAVEMFVRVVGGRDQLAEVLAIVDTGQEVDRVVTQLLDPRYADWSLRRLCTLAGITVAELFAAYKKALITRAHIQASHVIAARLLPVVEDVMTRAAPQRQVCPACAGAADKPLACATCAGSGHVQTEPDLDRQKLALELGQLLEKKGGLTMVQNNAAISQVASTAPGSLEQLQQAVGDLLFGNRRHEDYQEGEVSERPAELPDDESEPELPFGDPRAPDRRRITDPGMPEED